MGNVLGGHEPAECTTGKPRRSFVKNREKLFASRDIDPVKARRRTQHLTQNIVIENQDKEIRDYYEIDNMPVLGSGVSGTVKICVHRSTGIQYALKALSKRLVKREKLDSLRAEIMFMAKLDHPNILRIHEYFETKHVIYLVLELCRGGELLDRLHRQEGRHYSEKDACRYVHTMISAVSYAHSQGIVHRDLKLENFLLEDETEHSELKLIDFGLSQYFHPDEMLHSSVGTPYYVAPEVLQGNYGPKCDVWSIGVIAYMLLSGSPPFHGENDAATLQAVSLGRWKFGEVAFRPVSKQAKDFITKCLSRRVRKRPSAAEALTHPWFQILKDDDVNNNKDSGSCRSDRADSAQTLDIVARLRSFVKRPAFAKVCMEVIAHTLLPEQIKDLRKDFAKLDISQTGDIRIEDLRKVLEENQNFSEEDLNFIFSGIDMDHTGKVSYHEFIAATLSSRMITEENLQVAFEKISSHEEYITCDNFADILGAEGTPEHVHTLFTELNLNENSKMDFGQFKKILTAGGFSPLVHSPYTSSRRRHSYRNTMDSNNPSHSVLLPEKAENGGTDNRRHHHIDTETLTDTQTDAHPVTLSPAAPQQQVQQANPAAEFPSESSSIHSQWSLTGCDTGGAGSASEDGAAHVDDEDAAADVDGENGPATTAKDSPAAVPEVQASESGSLPPSSSLMLFHRTNVRDIEQQQQQQQQQQEQEQEQEQASTEGAFSTTATTVTELICTHRSAAAEEVEEREEGENNAKADGAATSTPFGAEQIDLQLELVEYTDIDIPS